MGDKVTIIGIRHVDFKDQVDGKQVTGFTFYFTQVENSQSLEGLSCGKAFISQVFFDRMSYVPSVGTECFVIYNKYGKVSAFAPIN